MRKLLIPIFLAVLAGCSPVDDGPLVYCEALNARCWVFDEGWGAWALHYPEGHMSDLEDADAVSPMLPPPAGDACWKVGPSTLPICMTETDGIPVFGHPAEIGEDRHEIVLLPSTCADLYPWAEVMEARGMCFGLLDGLAVQLTHT